VKTVSQLFLLFKDLFLVGQAVTKSNVLKTVLMNLLVFGTLMIFPVLYHFCLKLLASTRENGVLSHSTFKILELILNFLALCLLLIKFGLQLTSHPIVTILGFFQVVANLMDVG
jgi:hypothetical protein